MCECVNLQVLPEVFIYSAAALDNNASECNCLHMHLYNFEVCAISNSKKSGMLAIGK